MLVSSVYQFIYKHFILFYIDVGSVSITVVVVIVFGFVVLVFYIKGNFSDNEYAMHMVKILTFLHYHRVVPYNQTIPFAT